MEILWGQIWPGDKNDPTGWQRLAKADGAFYHRSSESNNLFAFTLGWKVITLCLPNAFLPIWLEFYKLDLRR